MHAAENCESRADGSPACRPANSGPSGRGGPAEAQGANAPAKPHIKVLVADTHPVVRSGLRVILARHPRLQVVGEAASGEEAARKALALRPDVVLMGIEPSRASGLAAMEVLRRGMPGVKTFVLSAIWDPDYAIEMIQSGARGFVLKNASEAELVMAIETVYGGETFFSPEIARSVLTRYVFRRRESEDSDGLTKREREVLALLAEGLSNKEIAIQLSLGVRTVETHRYHLVRKLGIRDVAGLTRFAVARGLVRIPGAELGKGAKQKRRN